MKDAKVGYTSIADDTVRELNKQIEEAKGLLRSAPAWGRTALLGNH